MSQLPAYPVWAYFLAVSPKYALCVSRDNVPLHEGQALPGSGIQVLPGVLCVWVPGLVPCHSSPDIRDSLMQALASYVCYPHSLRAVERIPEEQ